MMSLPFTAGAAGLLHHRVTATVATGVDDAATVRRLNRYRRAARAASISVPAEALSAAPVAGWARRSGSAVHTGSGRGVELALAAGVVPARITLHCNDDDTVIERAVHAGVGRLVVGSRRHLDVITGCAPQTQRVVVDLSAYPDPHLALRVTAARRLDLVGVHQHLTGPDEAAVASMIAAIASLRRRRGHLVPRLSIAGLVSDGDLAPRDLRSTTDTLESAVEDACARFRYPRPALIVEMETASW